jgi:hypothetical protein
MLERFAEALHIGHCAKPRRPTMTDWEEVLADALKVASAAAAARAVVNIRFDVGLLARIDAAAMAQGISRTAWLHVAAAQALGGRWPASVK